MPWSSCDGIFYLDQINHRWNNFHVTFPHAVSWILCIVVVMHIFHGICKEPDYYGYPVDWSFLSTDNTYHLVLLLQVMTSYCSTVTISERTALNFYPMWEYTIFGTPIGLLNLRTNDSPNIVLYDKCHNLTSKARQFPLGTSGTEPIADARTCTVYMEMFPLGTLGTEPVDDARTRTVHIEIL